MESIKSFCSEDEVTGNWRWAIYVDGVIHAFGYGGNKKGSIKNHDKWLDRALSGETEPMKCTNPRIPKSPNTKHIKYSTYAFERLGK